MVIDWNILKDSNNFEELIQTSFTKDICLLKHSYTCSISLIVKARIESGWQFDDKLLPYFIDVKNQRQLSLEIAEKLDVHHESPQILLIRNGNCYYDESHLDISIKEIAESLAYNAS